MCKDGSLLQLQRQIYIFMPQATKKAPDQKQDGTGNLIILVPYIYTPVDGISPKRKFLKNLRVNAPSKGHVLLYYSFLGGRWIEAISLRWQMPLCDHHIRGQFLCWKQGVRETTSVLSLRLYHLLLLLMATTLPSKYRFVYLRQWKICGPSMFHLTRCWSWHGSVKLRTEEVLLTSLYVSVLFWWLLARKGTSSYSEAKKLKRTTLSDTETHEALSRPGLGSDASTLQKIVNVFVIQERTPFDLDTVQGSLKRFCKWESWKIGYKRTSHNSKIEWQIKYVWLSKENIIPEHWINWLYSQDLTQ